MQNRALRSIGRFFAGTGDIVGTPSGDARGHLRVYAQKIVTRERLPPVASGATWASRSLARPRDARESSGRLSPILAAAGGPRGHAAGRKLAAGYSEKYAGKRRGFFLRR